MTILFFDGYCGLCNRVVDFLMRIDTKKILTFTPLQGETAQKHLAKEDRENLETVILLSENQVYRKSRAVFQVFSLVGGRWTVLSWLRLLPRALTDFGYEIVAKNRYNWFGKRDTCRLPSPEERSRFLP